MSVRNFIYILIVAVLLIGIAVGFVFIFQDRQERQEFADRVREERVHRFITTHSISATPATYRGKVVYRNDRIVTPDGTVYEVTGIAENVNGEKIIQYQSQEGPGSISEEALGAMDDVEIRTARRLVLAGVQIDGVTMDIGTKLTDPSGTTYTVSGIFSYGGEIEVTYIGDEGDAYALVLTHTESESPNTFSSGGDTVTVSMSTTQVSQTLTDRTEEIEQAISELEAEAEAARAAGDIEKALAAEEKITELEDEIALVESEVTALQEEDPEATESSTSTDSESTETTTELSDPSTSSESEETNQTQETSSTETSSTTSTTTQTEETTATPTVLPKEDDEEVSVSTPPATGSPAPVVQTSQVDENEYELYYNEEEKRWDINWGTTFIQLIP